MDRGNAGTHGSFADYELTLARDERGVADFYTFYVGYGVVWAGSAIERDAQIPGARLSLGGRCQSQNQGEYEPMKLEGEMSALHKASWRTEKYKGWGARFRPSDEPLLSAATTSRRFQASENVHGRRMVESTISKKQNISGE